MNAPLMSAEFENLLCTYCAPAMAGIKPASIVTCHKAKLPRLEQDLLGCRQLLLAHGKRSRVLCQCEKHLVFMVYDPTALAADLAEARSRRMLTALGYPREATAEQLLDELSLRMQLHCGFPHEIGLFLGYPVRDVEEFIRQGGKDCLCTGYWKVYFDADRAKQRFAEFDACRDDFLAQWEQGRCLSQILRVG